MAMESKDVVWAKNKVKFICSYGGMILPRPCDGNLKYVGGETRVVSAHRNILLADLMRKINKMFEGELVVKYQIGGEELDALVSVRSDEELGYMFDEYERIEKGGGCKLRAYLFPAAPAPVSGSNQLHYYYHSLEQRYVDAVNGIVRLGSSSNSGRRQSNSSSRLKSVCSSPTSSECGSPSSTSQYSPPHNHMMHGGDSAAAFVNSNRLHGNMTRVQSSPSLFGLASNNHVPAAAAAGFRPAQHHLHQQQHWSTRDLDYARLPIITNPHSHHFHKPHNRCPAHLTQYSAAYFT